MGFGSQERGDEKPESVKAMLTLVSEGQSSQEKRNHNKYYNKENLIWGIDEMSIGRNTVTTEIITSGNSFILSTGETKRKDWNSQKNPRSLEDGPS